MTRVAALTLTVLVSALCFGCGGSSGSSGASGGGGGADPVTYSGETGPASVSRSNAKLFVDEVLTGGVGAGIPSASAERSAATTGTSASRIVAPWRRIRTDAQEVAARTPAASARRVDRIQPCDVGQIRYSGSIDTDGTGELVVSYEGCTLQGETADGKMRVTVAASDPSTGEPLDYSVSMERLTVDSVTERSTVSGAIHAEVNLEAQAERLTFDLVTHDELRDRTVWAKDVVLTNTYDQYPNPGSFSCTMTGRIYDSAEGYVDVETDEPLTYGSLQQAYPDGGRLRLAGAGGARILVAGVSESDVSVNLDLDGNGSWELSARLPWTELRSQGSENTRPLASAGPALSVIAPGPVALDGSGSADEEHDFLSFRWELVERPEGSEASLTGASTAAAQFTADKPGQYLLRLVVSDGVYESEASLSVTAAVAVATGTPERVEVGVDDVLYFLNADRAVVERWSLAASESLPPIDLQGSPSLMTYSPVSQSLYLGYPSGAITRVTLDETPQETALAGTPLAIRGLAAVGDYLLAADSSGAWDTHYVYSLDGRFIMSADWNYYSREYAWSEANRRVYFFRDDTSPNDLHFEEIGPDGRIVNEGETPYHGAYQIAPPIRVSPDGSRVLLGSGDVYDGITLAITGTLPIEPADALWLEDGLLTLRPGANGSTVLQQWDSDLTLFNEQVFAGSPLRILGWSGGYAVLTLAQGLPVLHPYVPTDDSDGDGVPNRQDAFPMDPAASVDSDGDGWPDAWNQGADQGSSTSGLRLDAFPNDAACQLPEHALPGEPETCNIARAIPPYTPEKVEVGLDDVLYLFSRANEKVFRWSLGEARHLNPIDLGPSPRHVAYSPTEHLYVAYESGEITRIDLLDGAREESFVTLPGQPLGLAAVGEYLLAVDPSGAWDTHYTFGPEGIEISREEWNYFSTEYIWSETNRRLYFLRDGMSPNDLHYEVIDAQGNITVKGETPYHGDHPVAHPIRVSVDGSRVLLGSGDLYDGNSMLYLGSLPVRPVDALWRGDEMLTLRQSPDGRTLVERWSAGLTLMDWRYVQGTPIRIVGWSGGTAVITLVNGRPSVQAYNPASRVASTQKAARLPDAEGP